MFDGRSRSFGRIGALVLHPRSYFAQLRRPRVLGPLTVIVAIFIVSSCLTIDIAVNEEVARLSQRGIDIQSLRDQGANPDLKLKVKALFFEGLGCFLSPSVAALLGWGLASLILDGLRYAIILSIVLMGEIIYDLGELIRAVLIAVRETTNITFSPLAITTLIGLKMPSQLSAIMSQLELFRIWQITLVAIGYSAVLSLPMKTGVKLSILSVGCFSIIRIIWVVLC